MCGFFLRDIQKRRMSDKKDKAAPPEKKSSSLSTSTIPLPHDEPAPPRKGERAANNTGIIDTKTSPNKHKTGKTKTKKKEKHKRRKRPLYQNEQTSFWTLTKLLLFKNWKGFVRKPFSVALKLGLPLLFMGIICLFRSPHTGAIRMIV